MKASEYYSKVSKNLKKKYSFCKRKFLNKGMYHSTAVIVGQLDIHNIDHIYVGLWISDCDRKISLSLDSHSKKDRANSIYKLNTIIETCQEMKEKIQNLDEFWKEAKKHKKEYNKRKEKEQK